jgi:hypothetical protein
MISRQLEGLASFKTLTGCGRTPIHRHSREGGSPGGIKNTGFLLPQEGHIRPKRAFSADCNTLKQGGIKEW